MARLYYACAFSASSRAYTYHYDGEAFDLGDKVVVTTNKGPSVVTVMSITNEAPEFETKPIVGKDRPPQPVAAPADDFTTDIDPKDLF